jgi:hypothetical protein
VNHAPLCTVHVTDCTAARGWGAKGSKIVRSSQVNRAASRRRSGSTGGQTRQA